MNKLIYTAIALLAFLTPTRTSAATDARREVAWCEAKIHKALKSLGATDRKADYSMMPRNIEGDATTWHCRPATPEEWCSGFWPGILWMDYAATGDEKVRRQAERYTAALKPILERPVYDHDLGFLFFCSYGKGYEATGDEAEMMLATLSSDRYRAGADSPAFLLHSTGNHPAGSEIDASIVYADYYYLEALERLTKRQEER